MHARKLFLVVEPNTEEGENNHGRSRCMHATDIINVLLSCGHLTQLDRMSYLFDFARTHMKIGGKR